MKRIGLYVDPSTQMALGTDWQPFFAGVRAFFKAMSRLEPQRLNEQAMASVDRMEDYYAEAIFSEARPEVPQIASFRYEPWASANEMLWSLFASVDWEVHFVATSGPEATNNKAIVGDNDGVLEWLGYNGPAGWARWQDGIDHALYEADQWGYNDVIVVSRGPWLEADLVDFDVTIGWAKGSGIKIHAIPMGNEPRFSFPSPDLRKLAEATGGHVWYPESTPADPHDFHYLVNLVPRIVEDLS